MMPNIATPRIYEFGEFLLDTARMLLLRRDGEVVPMQPRAYDLLRVLLGATLTCARTVAMRQWTIFGKRSRWSLTSRWARFYLGKCYAEKSQYEEAAREHRRAIEASGESAMLLAALAFSNARSGKVGEARGVLDRMKASARRGYVSPYSFATIYAGLGDRREAVKWLQKAFEDHDPQMATLKDDIHFDGLRDDPQFAGLMQRVGLTP